MKLKKLQIGIMAFMMTASMAFWAAPEVFAEEEAQMAEGAVDEEGNPTEGAVDENGDPIEPAQAEAPQQGGIVMSGIPSNNGKIIASQFPEEYIPEGFHKSTCTYEGQTIEIAYMDKGNGEVVLAYLADADGSNGDFYLCDINTAEMSDFVQIYGGEGKYIIVLDPRDMIVAPAGFTKANLQWYGKSVAAWMLPGNGSEDEKEKDEAKAAVPALFDACAGVGRTMTVYAAGAGDEDEEQEPEENDGADAQASSDAEDGSGVVAADPSQYFMVYAINQEGVIGFYLYDTVEGTYQRYVQVDSSGGSVEKYRSSAQTRLIVIAALAVALVICLFVMINLILKQRDRDDDYEDDEDEDDEDDEMEQMRRRVAKKEKKHIRTGRRELNYLMDDEDEDEDEDMEEEDMGYNGPDWEHMEISIPTARQSLDRRREEPTPLRSVEQRPAPARPAGTRPVSARPASAKPLSSKPAPAKATQPKTVQPKAAPARPSSKKATRPKPDLDEDFEFEFLDI